MNLKPVDFLDVRFDLINNTYRHFRKPNSEPVYIHKQSNHPSNILKELSGCLNCTSGRNLMKAYKNLFSILFIIV